MAEFSSRLRLSETVEQFVVHGKTPASFFRVCDAKGCVIDVLR
jgi:hypothetical protein